jgi:hypothetical protein
MESADLLLLLIIRNKTYPNVKNYALSLALYQNYIPSLREFSNMNATLHH